jgi:single-strand DNA-binding protein
MSYQQCLVVGNVGRDPELKYLQSGTAVVNFSVAVNEAWTDSATNERREKTVWFRVSAFGRLAETVNQYVRKGKEVLIIGTVEVRAYTDNSGQPAASLDLRAREVRFLGGKSDREGGEGGQYDDFAPPQENVSDIPF